MKGIPGTDSGCWEWFLIGWTAVVVIIAAVAVVLVTIL